MQINFGPNLKLLLHVAEFVKVVWNCSRTDKNKKIISFACRNIGIWDQLSFFILPVYVTNLKWHNNLSVIPVIVYIGVGGDLKYF